MNKYQVNNTLLREREYYDTQAYEGLFDYARAMAQDDDFNPENAVLGVTVGSPNLYTFNLPAALVLEAVAQGMPEDELLAQMTALFDVEAATVAADVAEIVDVMLRCEIIRPA